MIATTNKPMMLHTYGRLWLSRREATIKPGTMERYRYVLLQLEKAFGYCRLDRLTANDVSEWCKRRSAELKPRSYNIEAQVVQSILTEAERDGYTTCPAAIIRRVRVGKLDLKVPNMATYGRILQWLRENKFPREADLVEFMGSTGCRVSEARLILWNDIDFERGEIMFRDRKNGDDLRTPLFPSARKLLERLRPLTTTGYIFSVNSAKKGLDAARLMGGFPRFTNHTFRHFFATEALRRGVPPNVVSSWLGHRDPSIVLRIYAHVLSEHSRAEAEKMVLS
jgi:integrase